MNVTLASEQSAEQNAEPMTSEQPAATEVTAEVAVEVVAEVVVETPSVATPAHFEQHASNELMRHIPSLAWLCEKLDGDMRRRIDRISASVEGHVTPEIEEELRALSRALDRLADAAKHIRNNGHGPNEPLPKLRWSLNHALTCLRLADAATFARRAPFHTFERSKSEAIYGAFLVVIDHLGRVLDVVRPIDPGIDERLYEGLVKFEEPMREQPIA